MIAPSSPLADAASKAAAPEQLAAAPPPAGGASPVPAPAPAARQAAPSTGLIAATPATTVPPVPPAGAAPSAAGAAATSAANATVGTWRQVVADYLVLTTPETLALLPANPRLAEAVAIYGGKLQLDLTTDKLMVPMASLRDVRLYDYRGRPLVEAAYLSDDGTSVLSLCIIASTQPDAAPSFEQRNGHNIVFWNANGRGYMLAGKAPRETLEAVARALADRFS
jgi:hypothetical protein